MGVREVVIERMREMGVTPARVAEYLETQGYAEGLPGLARALHKFVAGGEIKVRHLDEILCVLYVVPWPAPRRGEPLRSVIKAAMKNRGMTTYQLSQAVKERVPQRTIYNFLAGGEIKTRYLDVILDQVSVGFYAPRNQRVRALAARIRGERPYWDRRRRRSAGSTGFR